MEVPHPAPGDQKEKPLHNAIPPKAPNSMDARVNQRPDPQPCRAEGLHQLVATLAANVKEVEGLNQNSCTRWGPRRAKRVIDEAGVIQKPLATGPGRSSRG